MGLALKITGVDSGTQPVLSEVLKMLGHTQSEDGISVTVKQCGDGISIVKNKSEIQICYGKKNELFRAFSLVSVHMTVIRSTQKRQNIKSFVLWRICPAME